MKSLLLFVGGSLLFGAVALAAGYGIWGSDALVQGSAAFGVAFVPAAATLGWVAIGYRGAPDMKPMAALGASGVRMAVALGAGWYLTSSQPQLFDVTFWSWLVLFYLVMLALEITLLVRDESKLQKPQA